MSKLKNLLDSNDGRIYVYLANEDVMDKFLLDAIKEGFTFADGEKLTERKLDNTLALNRDYTINYVGFIGRIAFQTADKVGDEKLIKIDYREIL